VRTPTQLRHLFVEDIPEVLADHTVYVSVSHTTVVHKCFCGCGHEIVTPLSPAQWTLIFDGRSISLEPSVGAGSPCHSHYWIRRGRVEWASRLSEEALAAGHIRDQLAVERCFDRDVPAPAIIVKDEAQEPAASIPRQSWRQRFVDWWLRLAGRGG